MHYHYRAGYITALPVVGLPVRASFPGHCYRPDSDIDASLQLVSVVVLFPVFEASLVAGVVQLFPVY